MNKVILVGNLGRDPEVRHAQDGSKIVQLSVATSEVWKDKVTGESKDRTEWHRVVIFNERLADVAEKYLRKGSKLYLEGQLQTRKWTDQEGNDRYTTEISLGRFRGEMVLLDRRGGEETYATPPSSYEGAAVGDAPRASAENSVTTRRPLLDDDIPF